MKNKKGLSLIMTLLFIILMIFVAIGIFWFVTTYGFEPHFKITTEVMVNETIFLYEYKCDGGGIEKSERRVPLIYNENNIRCLLQNTNYPEERVIVKYEQVEVGEIEIYRFKDIHNFTEDISDREHKCTFNEKTEYYVCESYFGLKRISKQDLTIDWLEKNCEQICNKDCEGFPRVCGDGPLMFGDENKIVRDGDCECERYCEYKCGDYTVETQERIK